MRVLGIMSGTSIDGVDYAFCRITESSIKMQELWHAPFPAPLRTRLHRAASGNSTAHEVAQLHHDLGRFYASHVRGSPELVGLHGQTIFHNPAQPSPATLQIGEPAWLAEKLRVPVISNFRAGDLAAGGQGAPLASMFHCRVFGVRGRVVCVNNLGGISNVTFIDWRHGKTPRVMAFDTGPANVLLDMAMRHFTKRAFDKGGAMAAKGTPDKKLLQRWMRHPFFAKPPPRSTGREMFGETFWNSARKGLSKLSQYDALATLTQFTARSIADAYVHHLPTKPDRVILCGGGAANLTLRKFIAAEIPGIEVVTSQDLGWPISSIEPAAFALLAWLRIHRRPGNIPETTGARRAVMLGQITASV